MLGSTMQINPAGAECTYDGVTFDAIINTKISGRPVVDAAKRTVIGWEYTLDVSGPVSNSGGSTDAQLTNLRTQLTAPGGNLRYLNKGFGTLQVNDGGGVRDLAFGPWPELLSFRPMGNNLTAMVDWRVRTTIPRCAGVIGNNGILEFSYTIDYDIDQDGYTTITVSGSATVAMTRQTVNNPALIDDADRLRESVMPTVVNGFQRTSQHFSLSLDKRTLTFRVTDKEVPESLPAGCTAFDVRHTIGSSMAPPNGFISWMGNYSATVTTAKGYPRSLGLVKFLAYVYKRLGLAKANLDLVKSQGGKGCVLITDFRIDEQPFGRSSSFSLGYRLIGATLANFVAISGLYTASGNTFAQWRDSMAVSAWNPRGATGLRHQPAHDRIIDLCISQQITVSEGQAIVGPNLLGIGAFADAAGGKIDPKNSWLGYENKFSFRVEYGRVMHTPLGAPGGTAGGPTATDENAVASNQGGQAALTGAAGAAPVIVQQVHAPTIIVHMHGRALRLQYQADAPTLVKVGNSVPIMLRDHTVKDQPTSVGGVPIHRTRWQRYYSIPVIGNNGIPVCANPVVELAGVPA